MIYKFIDDHGTEITVNSLSQLQTLVESQTIKKQTKVKAGLRGEWKKAKDVPELQFEDEKKEEVEKKTEDIESFITKEPTPPPKKETITKTEKPKVHIKEDKTVDTKVDLKTENKQPKEKIVKTDDAVEPSVKQPSEVTKVEQSKIKKEESENFYDDDQMEDINIFQSIKICFQKYFVIKGRASRSEYWWFFLLSILFDIIAEVIDLSLGYTLYEYGPFFFISLITVIPTLTVYVRRLHDVNKSGWWILIFFTVIGLIPLFIWTVSKGTRGKNRFGEYPLKYKNREKKIDEQQKIHQTIKDKTKNLIKDKNIFKYLFIVAVIGLVLQFFVMGENDLFVKTKSSKKEEKDDNLAKVDNLPKELFGVKILDSPEKYLYENAQGREKDYGGILKHTWYRAKDLKNLVTNTFFDRYDIAVVDNSIAAIQANRIIAGYLTQKEFKEACVDKRENFFTRFLKENNINRDVFNRKYYKGKTKTNRIFFVDRISTDYNYNNNDLKLYFSCNYGFKLEGVEKINTTFIYRLSTSEASAAGEKYTNYKSTPKFNATYLKSLSLEE